jgi:hypothetical protein
MGTGATSALDVLVLDFELNLTHFEPLVVFVQITFPFVNDEILPI